MKRRELLTHAGKVAAAAAVVPLLPLGHLPIEMPLAVLKPGGLTTEYLVTFEGKVRELMVWDRALSKTETSDLAAYLEKKYATA